MDIQTFDISTFVKNYLNIIKCEKKLTRKDIMENEKLCVIHISDDENYNKSHMKLCNSCNIKGLHNNIVIDDDNDVNELMKKFNIISFGNEKSFINILLNSHTINNVTQNKRTYFPNHDLDLQILNKIMINNNVIINIDSSLSNKVEELAYVIIYIGYYVNNNNKLNSVKIKCKNIDNLKYSMKYIKHYADLILTNNNLNIDFSDSKNIINNIREKKIIDEKLKEILGGTKFNVILHKRNIKNVSKNKMRNTHNFLKRYLNDCYNNNNDNNNNAINEFQDILDIFQLLCKPNNTPPSSIVLETLNAIQIEKINNDDDLKFLFCCNNDSFERYVSCKFFQEASDEFIATVFEDLFLHDISKMKVKNNICLKLKKNDLDTQNDNIVFGKIFNVIKSILSKAYDITNINTKETDIEFSYIFLSKENDSKRKKEEEEEDDELLFKVGKKEAKKIMRAKKKK